MARQFPGFEEAHRRFAEAQPIFFVATAAETGRVNLSPKGGDSLRITGPNSLLWRNLTGSGNETAGHLLRVNRMTLMWCAFDRKPLILRAYGTARAIHHGEADWAALDALFPPDPGARQVFEMQVETVQTSCGYAVPFMDYAGDRDTLRTWTEDRARTTGIAAYWAETNAETIDGFPTGMPAP